LRFAGVVLCAVVLSTGAFAQYGRKKAAAASATATLHDAQGKTVGTATLKERKGQVRLSLKVNGLAAGEHAFHIHEAGKCEAPAFTTAGGHFNPEKKQHGHMNPQGAHLGDLPNITVAANGKGQYQGVVAGVTLAKGPANSLFGPNGTALVIHEKADDNKSDPAGNAGPRIACGVIQ
jgi:Cu-Zn family superoxide dismutase